MEKTLLEQAEEARQVGDRKTFLLLKEKVSAEDLARVQATHVERLEQAKAEFPVDSYVLGRKIAKINDGCGTQRGWIQIEFSDGTKKDIQELRSAIAKAKESARVSAYFQTLKCPRSGRVYLGQYDEAVDDLLTYIGIKNLWGLQEWDEENIDSWSEMYTYAYNEAVKEGFTDTEAEEKAHEAEDEARADAFNEYREKFLGVLRHALSFADLTLVECKNYNFYLEPVTGTKAKDWHACADKMAKVISGYGTFVYKNGQELKEIGPYKTYSKAVVDHIHWVRYGPEIYGGRGFDIR